MDFRLFGHLRERRGGTFGATEVRLAGRGECLILSSVHGLATVPDVLVQLPRTADVLPDDDELALVQDLAIGVAERVAALLDGGVTVTLEFDCLERCGGILCICGTTQQ